MKQRLLKALDVTVPAIGVSDSFRENGLYITALPGCFSVLDTRHPDPSRRNSAQLLITPIEVVRACRWPTGTPTGEALRDWLVGHGYERPGKAAADPTKTII
jgi:hypothetical protein